jgi:hypothetical protein
MTLQAHFRAFVAVVALSAPIYAASAPILADFEDAAADPSIAFMTNNFVLQGVSFSPNCHAHIATMQANPDPFSIFDSIPAAGGKWLGFDPSGCEAIHNDSYSGPAGVGREGKIFVSLAGGGQFDLMSFDFVRYSAGPDGLQVQSSRGGDFTFFGAHSYQNFSFAGPEWSNLEWVVFSQEFSATFSGFDNLVLNADVARVPEPGSSAAWLALIVALRAARKKTKGLSSGRSMRSL